MTDHYSGKKAAEKERDNAERQVANPTRSTDDGMRGFFIRAPFPVIALFDARVQWFADVLASLGDTDDRAAPGGRGADRAERTDRAERPVRAEISHDSSPRAQTQQAGRVTHPACTGSASARRAGHCRVRPARACATLPWAALGAPAVAPQC